MAVTINGTTGILAPDIGIDGTTLTVDAVNNRVGIGTTTPFGTLQVRPGTNANFSFSTGAGESSLEIINDAGSANVPLNVRASEYKIKIQGTEKLHINSAGNIGIGVDPANVLHIKNDSPIIRLESSATSYVGRNTIGQYQSGLYIDCDNDNAINNSFTSFSIDGSEKLRITSGGQVLVGNYATHSSIHGNLEVNGNDGINISNSYRTGTNGVQWRLIPHNGGAGQSPSNLRLYEGTGATEVLNITKEGKVLLGRTSTTHEHPLQVQAASGANAIAIQGRSVDDQSEITFYENDNSTITAQIQQLVNRSIFRHRVGYLRFDSGGVSETMRLDANGNLNIGAKGYHSHSSSVDSLQIGYAVNLYEDSYSDGGVAGNDNYLILANNARYNGGNKYMRNDEASRIMMNSGNFYFQSAAAGTAGNNITFTDRLLITAAGQTIVNGSTNLAHPNMDDIIVGDATGNRGITICSGTAAFGSVCFGDSADGSGNDRYEGYVEYYHNDNSLRLGTAHTEKVHIKSNGDVRMGPSTFGPAKCKLDIIEDQSIPYGITTAGSIDFVGIMVRTLYYCEFTVQFPPDSTNTSVTLKFSRSSNAPSISVDYFTGGGYQVDHGATGNAYISFLSANGNTLYTGTNHQAAYGGANPSWSHGNGTTDVIFKLSNLAYTNTAVCHFKINIPRGGINNITVDRTTP